MILEVTNDSGRRIARGGFLFHPGQTVVVPTKGSRVTEISAAMGLRAKVTDADALAEYQAKVEAARTVTAAAQVAPTVADDDSGPDHPQESVETDTGDPSGSTKDPRETAPPGSTVEEDGTGKEPAEAEGTETYLTLEEAEQRSMELKAELERAAELASAETVLIVAVKLGGSWYENPETGQRFNGKQATLDAGLILPDEES
ncbi:hypothetical protein KAW64_02775 [bacterium]|nr:hypothetical protein [bacterium]